MKKHEARLGIALLVALSLLTFAAPSAAAKGTTAFGCVEGGAEDFTDSHCAEGVEIGTGKFGHSAIAEGQKTPIVLSNEKTGNETKEAVHTILKGKAFGAATEITCATVNGTSTIENVAKGVDGVMATEGKEVGLSLTNCAVSKPAKCSVVEPIKLTGASTTRVGLGAEKNTMGVEFKPPEGQPLATITYVNKGAESCALNGKAINLEGTIMATGSRGSNETVDSTSMTLEFTVSMTKETLSIKGVAAELTGTVTVGVQGPGGTTAFSCVEGGSKNFADTHCAEEVGVGTGEFGHSDIEGGKTSAVLTNEKTQGDTKAATPMLLNGTVGEVSVEIECAAIDGTFSLENVNPGIDGTAATEGKNVEIDLTNCKVRMGKEGSEACTVATPVEIAGTSTTRVGLGAEKNTMGVEFKPPEGQPLATITFKNNGAGKCSLHEGSFKLTGTALATGSRGPDQTVSSTSATLELTAAMTKETLKFAGNTVELESSLTVRKGAKEGKITFETTPTGVTLTTTES